MQKLEVESQLRKLMALISILKRWSRPKIAFGALFVCGLLLGIWSIGIEPGLLAVNQTSLALPEWPEAFDHLKIVAIADLHVGSPHITLGKLQRVVKTINEMKPDVVVLLGDYVIHGVVGGSFTEPESIADQLKGLRANLAVAAVLGNHDWWYDGPRVTRALQQAGIRVLENEAIEIQRHGQSFWLAGVGDYWTWHHNLEKTFAQVTNDAPVIALTHSPDLFPKIPAQVILTLAGHTHGGQVNLPLIGRPIVPSAFGQRYAIGHIEENQHHLFVTSGIGTSILPVRLRVLPEILVLTIVARPQTMGERR